MTLNGPACLALLMMVLVACQPQTVEHYVRPTPEYAIPAAADGAFTEIESALRAAHGSEVSGFKLVDTNSEALRWRLALIDSAKHSIDLQYYLWDGDDGGRVMAKRLLDAADRGVKVRMLVDDINTLMGADGDIGVRDTAAAWVDAHRNFEIRLFNPWSKRNLYARAGEMLTDLERLNQRMHNKSMIVDNQAVILGGRNIGAHYFGLSEAYNFRDLDVLGVGPVARQTSRIFDAYWNSRWVMPVSALNISISQSDYAAARVALTERVRGARSLAKVPAEPQSWSTELGGLAKEMHTGPSRVASDMPVGDDLEHVMLEEIHSMLASARKQLLIMNAYIIPAERGIGALKRLGDLGVDMKILTNSLASHDVPAVNSHYKQWRKPILKAGAELYEIRHDAEIQTAIVDTPPTAAEFMGLHAKAMVVDRRKVFIGSMNYDPRSAEINTEMGVFVDSPGLAEALAALIERDTQPINSWRVELTEEDDLRWVTADQQVTCQPARNWWQRVEDLVFMAFPKELY